MAVILNIETSSDTCSVALTVDCAVQMHFENFDERNHASTVSGYIRQCLDQLRADKRKLDAVAVSIGPGSYTGLRIGLSEAKGVAYALNVPLIGIPTLQIMTASVMFNHTNIDLSTRFAPMLDARRMEVYTAVYDMWLKDVMPVQPLILTTDSYADLLAQGPLLMFGPGSDKARSVITHPNAHFISNIRPLATDMLALSEKAFRQSNFLDLAYSTPEYLKEFQAVKSRPLL
ncbi:MAG: tRNA (adenosine(37)-N6)-threonylcarbamoyltransferase complex dimerization subunit type 1 TsaB [Muribaculaceae bacterium]|nr:tRNA (adenosine(37)-N6)-threonylcarbamoyltransferase complex dimerization subunit type 1 TsaB [Muribaculaceae bacterium]